MASKSEQEYNKHRRLHLLNLPPSTEGEIKEFLVGIKVKDVQLSDKLDSAIVNVQLVKQVDEAVSKYDGKAFKDNVIIVKAATSEKLMCVAHFPLSYTDKHFLDMCKKIAPVKYAFTMQKDKTGHCKGYGLVEFDCDLEKAKSIKSQMDWMEVDGQILHVDFLDESVQTSYQELQSRCLFVTGMPETFTDITKMRELFGCVTSPVYCQIIAKDEKSLGYGIVEFKTDEEAEGTWFKMKDQKIEGNDVLITFCIPGKSAVVINNRINWKFADKLRKNSLLPDPINSKPVIGGHPLFISLVKMNPKLAVEFKAVLVELQQAYLSQKMVPADKPGLLGPAPALPLSPVMNPNMQLGLIVMLSMAIQHAKTEPFTGVLSKQLNTLSELDKSTALGPKPSILGDPITGQANVIITSLKQQLDEVPLKDDNGTPLTEPTRLDEKLQYINKKFATNCHLLSCGQLASLGQLLNSMQQMTPTELPPLKPPGGGGLLSTPSVGPPLGNSLLGPMPGMMNPLMGNNMNNMNEPAMNKGSSLLGDAPNMPLGGKPQSLLGMGPGGPSAKHLQQQQQQMQNQQQQQQKTNQAIVQAMGLGIGASGVNNLGQTLLGQISQGLVHQIGQNLMYQLNNNQPGSGNQSGKGLLGDVPASATGSSSAKGGKGKAGAAGKSSLLGQPPSQFNKSNQGGGGGPGALDQGSWKSGDGRWGSGSGYESGYGGKSGMGGSGGGGYNDYGGGYGDSYNQDMSGGGGGGGYGGGYHGGATGGFGDGDFYNTYNQQQCIQNESGYWEYASNFGGGGGSGSGSMSGANYGGGMGHMGSGGLGGLSSSQASGVNFQDGPFGKNATHNTGHGPDSSGRFGGGMDGFGGGMGGGGGGGGYNNYNMTKDDMDSGVNFVDSYGGSSGMRNNYNDMGGGSMGMGGSGGGMGGYGMGGGSGGGMGGYGMGGGSGGGMGMGGSGGGMGMGGGGGGGMGGMMGGGSNGMGGMSMNSMASMGMGMGSGSGGYGGSGGGSGNNNSQMGGAFSTSMGNNSFGSGGGGNTGNSLLGSGGGGGITGNSLLGSGGGGGGGGNTGNSLLGSGGGGGGGGNTGNSLLGSGGGGGNTGNSLLGSGGGGGGGGNTGNSLLGSGGGKSSGGGGNSLLGSGSGGGISGLMDSMGGGGGGGMGMMGMSGAGFGGMGGGGMGSSLLGNNNNFGGGASGFGSMGGVGKVGSGGMSASLGGRDQGGLMGGGGGGGGGSSYFGSSGGGGASGGRGDGGSFVSSGLLPAPGSGKYNQMGGGSGQKRPYSQLMGGGGGGGGSNKSSDVSPAGMDNYHNMSQGMGNMGMGGMGAMGMGSGAGMGGGGGGGGLYPDSFKRSRLY